MEEAGRRDSGREMRGGDDEERRGREGGDGQIRRIGGGTRRGHLERDETWRAVEIGMERCGVETVGGRGEGKVREVWGLKQFLAFCQKAGIYRI